MIDFTCVDAILAHQFVGNHAADCEAFCGIARFMLRDDVSQTDKLKAYNHKCVEGMGIQPITRDELGEVLAEH